jgi:phosphatidylserine/phosphatidylglycerophosphate/cardiolipin synthase-like enzyme
VHSKIIAADPFGTDPILVTGSANFSENSTTKNDSNSLLIRGDTATMDIYSTEFMRMCDESLDAAGKVRIQGDEP